MQAWKVALLLGVMVIIVLFALGLGNDPREIPSPLIGKMANDFKSESLDGGPTIQLSTYKGKWVMLNFWGSWCISCIREHPLLIDLAKKTKNRSDFVMIGVDFKDTMEGGKEFLARHGDPGYRQVFDPGQRITIDWGVYGAPESFIIDPQGMIRLKQSGPIYPGWFESKVLPLMNAAQGVKP